VTIRDGLAMIAMLVTGLSLTLGGLIYFKKRQCKPTIKKACFSVAMLIIGILVFLFAVWIFVGGEFSISS
jgi:multisubunit Na+/H+ antiporter MnhB subunit